MRGLLNSREISNVRTTRHSGLIMAKYKSPILDRLITVTNPAAAAPSAVDVYGEQVQAAAAMPAGEWTVFANRRDRRPQAQPGEAIELLTGFSIWTIRWLPDIDRAATVTDSGGVVFDMQGPPVERGGASGETLQRYLELHTVQRR